MEIQTLLNKLGNDIEEKNNLFCMEEAEQRDFCKVKLELDIAIENYNTIFSALHMIL